MIARARLPDQARLLVAQGRSRALALAWRGGDAQRAASAHFAGAERDNAETVGARAVALLSTPGWAQALLAPLIDALAADQWVEPPLRISRDRLRTGAILFEHPAVTITGAVLSAEALAGLPDPVSVVVPGRLAVVRFERGGAAQVALWRAEAAGADFAASAAAPCARAGGFVARNALVRVIDGRTHGQLIRHAARDVVTLTATVRAGSAAVMREYAIDGGALIRVAALDEGACRTQMLAAFLRHARRTDAGEAMAAATHEPAYFARWSAMREWLALDARGALPRLREMCADPNAEVRAAAAQTLTLVEETLACRA